MKMGQNKQILVVGEGSSGKRFIALLKRAGYKPVAYKHRTESLSKTLTGNFMAAIIASPTHTHAFYAKKLLQKRIPMLIEKPVVDNARDAHQILVDAWAKKAKVMVGLNLRFLPVTHLIADYVQNQKLGRFLFADMHVGQYLPFWRPKKDYQKTYSAHFHEGGGVALDLIHEIDLAFHWFGNIKLLKAESEHRSDLKTDVEDFVRMTFDQPFSIQITLDYLSHVPTRRYFIVGTKGTIHCDVYNRIFHFVNKDGTSVKKTAPELFDISATYKRELDAFLAVVRRKKTIQLTDRSLGIDALGVALKARKHV